jgi:PAS domain S-box-containing protein
MVMTDTTSLRILVLEDDAAHGEAVRREFKKAGPQFMVVLTSSIAEFFQEISRSVPALVITDARLPDGDVFDVLSRLGEARDFPVLVMTSFGDELMAVKVIKAGASDYIPKAENTFRDMPQTAGKALYEWRLIKEKELLQKSLQESREKFRSYVDNAPDGIFVTDETGKYVEVNRAAAEITGYSEAELLEMSIPDLLPPESVEAGVAHFAKILETGSAKGELQFRHKKGTCRWWSVDAVKLSETRFLGFAKDITERKTVEFAQQFLLQSGFRNSGETFFESLARFLGTTLGVYYVCIDKLVGDNLSARTLAVYCNGKFEDNLEYTLNDTPCGVLLGQPICYFPSNVSAQFPNDPALQEIGAESYIGATLWGFDGSPIGLIALLDQKPIDNPHAAETLLKMVAVRAAGELERLQAEEALRANEARYRAIMEQSFEAMAVIDITTQEIVEVNRRYTELFGYSLPEDAPLRNYRCVMDTPESIDRYFTEAAIGKRFLPPEVRTYRHKNGTAIPAERTGTFLNFSGREFLIVSIRDLTLERRRQAEVARDVEFAARTQRALLPAVPVSASLDIRTIYHPHQLVSGDFYHLEWNEEKKILRGFLIDVSGHGLATALQTASVSVLLREASTLRLPLLGQMKWVNGRAAKYFTDGAFAAMLGFELDLLNKEMRYVSAGITQFYVNGQKITIPGMFVGMWNDAEFNSGVLPVSVNDNIILLTDGFTDALAQPEKEGFWSPDGSNFEADVSSLEHLAGSGSLRDDATGICIRVR